MERLQISAFDFDSKAGLCRNDHLLDRPRNTRAESQASQLTPLVLPSNDRIPEIKQSPWYYEQQRWQTKKPGSFKRSRSFLPHNRVPDTLRYNFLPVTLVFDRMGTDVALDAPITGKIASGDVVVGSPFGRRHAGGAGSVASAVVESKVRRHQVLSVDAHRQPNHHVIGTLLGS